MLKRALYLMLVLIIATSLVFAGCSKSSPSTSNTAAAPAKTDQPVKKVKISYWDENAGPTRTPYHEAIIKNFMAAQNEVEVEYVGIPQSSALEKYNTAIAANETPDLAGVQANWVPNFIAKKAIVPLDDYFNKWSDKDKIMPSLISSIKNLSPQDGKIYMLPYSSNYTGIWYRADWFKDAGLTFPETWDDFFKVAEKLTDKSKNKYGFTIRGGQGSGAYMVDAMYSYSGIDQYFDANGKCTINDPKNIEFLKRFMGAYGKFTPESDITAGWPEMAANFDTGSCSMLIHNLGSLSNHMDAFKGDKAKFAFGPLPKSIKGNRVYQGGGGMNAVSMFANSKNKDAGFKYISWMMTPASEEIFNKPVGQMPTHKDALNFQWVKDAQHINVAINVMSDSTTKALVPALYLPDYSTILSKVAEPNVQAVYGGKMTVEDFCKAWGDAVDKAKAEYDKAMKK